MPAISGEELEEEIIFETKKSKEEANNIKSEPERLIWTRKTAVRTPFYIISALALCSNAAFGTGFIFNLISILKEQGLTES